MPIEVKRQSFADCETLTIFGAKRGKCNPTNTVRLQFSSLDDLKEFQNKLNNLFPENVIINENFREPEEDGYYLTQTGALLYRDGACDWSVRRPTVEDGQFETVPIARVWSDGLSALHVTWQLVVATFGAEAFPLVPVKFAD